MTSTQADADRLVRLLDRLRRPAAPDDLAAVEAACRAVEKEHCRPDVAHAILRFFRRFPDQDDHAAFWSLQALAETCPAIADVMPEYLRQHANAMITMMLRRRSNAGFTHLADVPIDAWMEAIATGDHSPGAKASAREFLAAQRR